METQLFMFGWSKITVQLDHCGKVYYVVHHVLQQALQSKWTGDYASVCKSEHHLCKATS